MLGRYLESGFHFAECRVVVVPCHVRMKNERLGRSAAARAIKP
jgi:hypothetical protein